MGKICYTVEELVEQLNIVVPEARLLKPVEVDYHYGPESHYEGMMSVKEVEG